MIRCLKDKTNTIHELCNIKKVSMYLFCYTIHPCVNIYIVRFGLGGEGVRKMSTICTLAKKAENCGPLLTQSMFEKVEKESNSTCEGRYLALFKAT